MFRLSQVIFRPSKEQVQCYLSISCTLGSHVLTKVDIIIVKVKKCKSKGLPWQAEVAQGIPGRLRPPIFLMFQHYKGGRSSAICTGHLHPRRNPWYSLSEAESTSGHVVLSGVPRKKSPVTPPGIDSETSRLVAQCLNLYATPGTVAQR